MPARLGTGDIPYLVVILTLALLFFLTYFNRFAGLRSGDGEYSGGMALLAGRLPYRDYYTAGPPLNQFKAGLELLLFGPTLLVTRACAVAERLVIATLLYVWLRRYFSYFAAALGSVITVIVSAGDRSDPLASYNHDAILFALLCGFAACLSLRIEGGLFRILGLALIAGAASGFSALTKQTVGLGTAVAICFVGATAHLRITGVSRALTWVSSYLIGFALPVLGVGAYLHRLGVLSPALNMLFRSGPAAKASGPADYLTRALYIGWDNIVWVSLGGLALVFTSRALKRSLLSPGHGDRRAQYVPLLLSGLALLAVAVSLAYTPVPAVWNYSKSAVYYALFGVTTFGIFTLYRCLARPGWAKERGWELAIFLTLGWTVAVTLSLSWPAFEAMTLPGLAVLIAAAVDGVQRFRVVLFSMLVVLVFFQIREKLDLPFTFGNQDESAVRFARTTSVIPALHGMLLPKTAAALIDDATTTMQSAPSEATVFTYPEMSLLYAVSGRVPPTFAGSHNIDVVPDWLANQDAQRLRSIPPAVVVYARPTEAQLEAEEALWRRGRPSGQRALTGALDALTRTYRKKSCYALRAGDNPVCIYVSPDVAGQ